jgi:hypothetical protein
MRAFRKRRRAHWAELRKEIEAAIDSVHRQGYCAASWQPEVVAVATPLALDSGQVFVLNMSTTTVEPPAFMANALAAPLLGLAQQIREAVKSAQR